jgi:hypothetical protein
MLLPSNIRIKESPTRMIEYFEDRDLSKKRLITVMAVLIVLSTLNAVTVLGVSASPRESYIAEPGWILLDTSENTRQPELDETIVYGTNEGARNLPNQARVTIRNGEKATWDTDLLNGEFSGTWGWNIAVNSKGESTIKITLGTAREDAVFLGPIILSYEFQRKTIYNREFIVRSTQLDFPQELTSRLNHKQTFESNESLFTSRIEFIYLSIEAVDGDEVLVHVNNTNSYYYVK